MTAPPLSLKAVDGQDSVVTCARTIAVRAAGAHIVDIGVDGVLLHKGLGPASSGIVLGSDAVPFERIHVRAVKGDVVFDGNVTFSKPPWPTGAGVGGTTGALAGVNTDSTQPVYTPVQTVNESGANNAMTQWVMANEAGSMGLRFVQNGRASTLGGGKNAALIHNASGDLYIGSATNTRAMGFFSTGPLANAVCIGVTQDNAPALISMERANLSSYKLIVNGVAWSTSWRTVSDRDAKENAQKITGALDKVRAITGYTYNLKGEPETRRMAGVMAQDVERVLPEAVDRFTDGKYALDYNAVLSLLVEAVKELEGRGQGRV